MATVWKTYSFSVLLAEAGTSDLTMLTYDPTLSRIRIDVAQAATDPNTGLAWVAGATWIVQRSIDLIHWTTVRGGTQATVRSDAQPVDDYEFVSGKQNNYRIQIFDVADTLLWTFRDSMIITVDAPWLKSTLFPFLNKVISGSSATPVSTAARGGVFDVVGTKLPVAVTDARGSNTFDLVIQTVLDIERQTMESTLAPGDVVFLQTPPTYPVPTGHYWVGDVTSDRKDLPWERRWFTLPLTGVSAPNPSLVGGTMIYRGLSNRYATYADMTADQATYRDLLELVAKPSDAVDSTE